MFDVCSELKIEFFCNFAIESKFDPKEKRLECK